MVILEVGLLDQGHFMYEHDGVSRIAEARRAVDELLEIVQGEGRGAAQWYRMLLDLRDALADTSDPPPRVLGTAAAMFDEFYAGPCNFADFYVMRASKQERVAANEHLSTVVA